MNQSSLRLGTHNLTTLCVLPWAETFHFGGETAPDPGARELTHETGDRRAGGVADFHSRELPG